jgi:hypothetical protein
VLRSILRSAFHAGTVGWLVIGLALVLLVKMLAEQDVPGGFTVGVMFALGLSLLASRLRELDRLDSE